jgi:hypothetical protein
MTGNGKGFGNILGDVRAENDFAMLSSAFYETNDYRALTQTQDYNIVVGRRGTGKSALYIKTAEYFEGHGGYRVIRISPEDSDNLLLQTVILSATESYTIAKYITSVAWRACIIVEIIKYLSNHYKARKCNGYKHITEYIENNKPLFLINPFRRVSSIIKNAIKVSSSPEEVPSKIADMTGIEQICEVVSTILEEINKTAVVLFDKLDEGLTLQKNSVAVVGGLAVAAGKFSEKKNNIYVCMYVRDNIFRLLSRFDRDFSRNIESCTLRLRWDYESLFVFIANRIRSALSLDIESHLKVWNRFAQRGLSDRDGFKYCLKSTLLRPRDLLALLNKAHAIACRSERHVIIDDDVRKAAFDISESRFNDLVKEYDEVFYGIDRLLCSYKEIVPFMNYQEFVDILDSALTSPDFSTETDSDFALLNSGVEAFKILYGIGFVGVREDKNSYYVFSFDGSPVKFDSLAADTKLCIHPCYWYALGVNDVDVSDNFYNEIHDDYTAYDSGEAAEIRTKLIGGLVAELPAVSVGDDGASKFEEWCLRVIKILFAGKLSNPELHPNGNAIQRRDIVATNCAQGGFWQRVITDYSSRQVIFEVKNFAEMNFDVYRQAALYAKSVKYGNFVILITRTNQEGLTHKEKGWLREIHQTVGVVIFTLPAVVLSRCISKLRSAHRFSYTENYLGKSLDTYERNYLSLRHSIS